MKLLLTTIALFFITTLCSQNLVGKWKTIDDETGQAKSIIEIYEQKGLYFGKIISLLQKEDQGKVCEKCNGTDKNKPIEGLIVLKNLKKEGKSFGGGQILDPKNGKTYKCEISFINEQEIKVRGHIGISLIGRNQVWRRV